MKIMIPQEVIEYIIELTKHYSNDQELGEQVREYIKEEFGLYNDK